MDMPTKTHKPVSVFFLLLVVAQGVHSVEEYAGKLWETFPPATFLTGLVSTNLETGFLIVNFGIILFGLLCWLVIRKSDFIGFGLAWFWAVLETANGIGHSLWALSEGMYVPGVATAPVLLILAMYMSWLLLRRQRNQAVF